jgi:hypothetical protein
MEPKLESDSNATQTSSSGLYRIGVFDDIAKARHAVEDAISAGFSRDDITMVAPSSDGVNDPIIDHLSVHPSADTYLGSIGGAIGGAIGGLSGSLIMYFMQKRELLNSVEDKFVGGALLGIAIGMVTGALIAYYAPAVAARLLHRKTVLFQKSFRDAIRASSAGAIGGMFGSFAGTVMSYVMGVPTLWYFIGMGFFAAAASLIVGGLVGAMSGRGLTPREVAGWEDLTDDDQNVLVSIDCHDHRDRLALVDDLLRRDGAMMVRTA